jgi:hypothetical protein
MSTMGLKWVDNFIAMSSRANRDRDPGGALIHKCGIRHASRRGPSTALRITTLAALEAAAPPRSRWTIAHPYFPSILPGPNSLVTALGFSYIK